MADADTSQSGAGTTATETKGASSLLDLAPSSDQAVAATEKEWFFADGIKGAGAPPEYFNSAKYKTLADQAKAQRELEKKLGSFTGAPEQYKAPEGIMLQESRLQKLTEFGKKHNMSQEAWEELVKDEDSAEEAEFESYIKEQKEAIGQDADKRIANISAWAKANLDEQGFNELKEAAVSATAFKVIERLISMTRQAPLPKPGQDTSTAGITAESVRAMHNELDSQGKRKYDIDPDHRKKVKAAYEQLYGTAPAVG